MSAISSNIDVRLAFAAEASFGVVPAAPSMTVVERTSHNINLSKDTYRSERVRADRQTAHLRHGTRRVEGEIQDELALNAHDRFLEAVLCGTWTNAVLTNGTVKRSFVFEEFHPDLSGEKFRRFSGVRFNTASISLPPTGLATVSYGLVGRDYAGASTALDASPDPAPAGDVLASVEGEVRKNGAGIAVVTGLELSIENAIAGDPVVGADTIPNMFYGRQSVTGSFTAYLETLQFVSDFDAENEISLSVTLNGTTPGAGMRFDLPRVKLTAANVPGGSEGGVTVSCEFTALLDPVSGVTISVTKIEPTVGGGE